ncbi:MAG: hypothetical protein LBI74_07800 [Synergistaceae bacterium]|jgi:hypothetical protein|nr:hypothetical protein [Synergistaceae bacterium]
MPDENRESLENRCRESITKTGMDINILLWNDRPLGKIINRSDGGTTYSSITVAVPSSVSNGTYCDIYTGFGESSDTENNRVYAAMNAAVKDLIDQFNSENAESEDAEIRQALLAVGESDIRSVGMDAFRSQRIGIYYVC